MKKKTIFGKALLGIGVLLLGLGTLSCKDETKKEDPKEVAEDQNEAKFDDTEDKEEDSQYLVDAAETDMKEIEIGKLAQERSTDQDIKNFGKMLVEDHTKSSEEIKKLAGRKSISLPASLTEKGQEKYKELNEKTGLDFDKKFAEMMVEGHEKAIDKMTKVAEKAFDEEIRVWASSKIPTLTSHLEHAKSLKEKVSKK